MWLAQTASDGAAIDSYIPQWVQAVGVVSLLAFLCFALIRGWLVSGSLHQSELSTRDKRIADQDEELRELRTFLRDEAMPLLTRSNDAVVRVFEELRFEERKRRDEP